MWFVLGVVTTRLPQDSHFFNPFHGLVQCYHSDAEMSINKKPPQIFQRQQEKKDSWLGGIELSANDAILNVIYKFLLQYYCTIIRKTSQ